MFRDIAERFCSDFRRYGRLRRMSSPTQLLPTFPVWRGRGPSRAEGPALDDAFSAPVDVLSVESGRSRPRSWRGTSTMTPGPTSP